MFYALGLTCSIIGSDFLRFPTFSAFARIFVFQFFLKLSQTSDTPIIGRDGFNIATEWDTNVPYARTGCQIKGCPNYFMILGPQSGQIHGTGSVTYGEHQAELAWRTIRHTLENGFQNFEVKAEKFDQWKTEYDTYQKEKKAWLTQCSSWYHKDRMNTLKFLGQSGRLNGPKRL